MYNVSHNAGKSCTYIVSDIAGKRYPSLQEKSCIMYPIMQEKSCTMYPTMQEKSCTMFPTMQEKSGSMYPTLQEKSSRKKRLFHFENFLL